MENLKPELSLWSTGHEANQYHLNPFSLIAKFKRLTVVEELKFAHALLDF